MKPYGGGRELSAWVRKGPWTEDEDEVLRRHVMENGPREWSSIRSKGLLPRTGKSCRLRWVNKLRPDIKKGCKFSADEERVVIDLQAQFGNKWARIATYLSGRTDNDVKNFWSTRQKRLARLQRAPGPRRRPGGASSSRGNKAKTLLHTGGGGGSSSSRPAGDEQEPHPCTVAPLAIVLPTHCRYDGGAPAELGSSYSSATPAAAIRLLSFCCGGGNDAEIMAASGVDPLVFVDPDDEAFCPEPLAVVPPTPFFGLDEEYLHFGSAAAKQPDVRFDDLPPETLDFFDLPPSGQP
ncbi:Transcription factor MYB120 [Zea mays]|uniref:Transcription factor MYB120 n=1 Tax=Zea mays TaxID=4577 RepID=A0A317YAC3_MAIZE|nr:Transcription factor MYB120 [Zea mays]